MADVAGIKSDFGQIAFNPGDMGIETYLFNLARA